MKCGSLAAQEDNKGQGGERAARHKQTGGRDAGGGNQGKTIRESRNTQEVALTDATKQDNPAKTKYESAQMDDAHVGQGITKKTSM